ncbi:MAG: polyphosphate polymerase domain-containing protein [Chloroflexales bacterium]|nr:polyphosphate polymerase domain-containing protein [Chloroflexales bacterium]
MTTSIDMITAQFAPISLAELNAQAALQTRTDNKYIVSADRFATFVDALRSSYRVLDIKGRRAFAYDTLYFDTPDMVSYWGYMQGRRRRFKARSRHYLDSSLCVFELKLKGGRGETIKHKINYAQSDLALVTPAAEMFIRQCLQEDYGLALAQPLVPTVLTHYRRVTLASTTSVERITCDFELAFASDGVWKGKILPGYVLIETKSERGRSDTDHLLWRLGARPTDGSKYCLGLSLARPELRNNLFRHTRNTFFMAEALQPITAVHAQLAGVTPEYVSAHTPMPLIAPLQGVVRHFAD